MGLHICYELALPRDLPLTEVTDRVRVLHEVAARLPFETVSSLVRVTDGEALGHANPFDCSLEEYFRLWAKIRLSPGNEEGGKRSDLPDAVGFTVRPGDYCEAATF